MSTLSTALKDWLSGAKKVVPNQLIKEGVINAKLIWMGVIGILLLVLGGVYDNSAVKPQPSLQAETIKSTPLPGRSYEEAIESKLANLLAQVRGAGTVAVSVT